MSCSINYYINECSSKEYRLRCATCYHLESVDKKLIEAIIRIAFEHGESWGVTYSTWFNPTNEQTEENIQKVIKQFTNN
jgi:hypothetical protein